MNRSSLIAPLVLSFVAVISILPRSPVRAQDSQRDQGQALQSNAELVKIDASVIDQHGNFASALHASDFRVLDNGAEQPIVFFAPVEAPVQVALMLETSPAVYLIHNEHLLGAFALSEGLMPEDQIALMTYDQTPRVKLAFTSDRSSLLATLGTLQYEIGSADLNFYDSVATAVDWLAGIPGKKAIVMLTTGLDMSPSDHWDSLVRKLRSSDVVIFPIALGGSLRTYQGKSPEKKKGAPKSEAATTEQAPTAPGSLSFQKADAALRSLATITGGRAWFPLAAKDFLPIYRQIATQLRNRYILGIAPAHDGQFHSLVVSFAVSHEPSSEHPSKGAKYRVFAREGYLAPAP